MSQLLLIGPSTRAMAYSAKRAGYDPLCIDLFADTDLQAIAPVETIPISEYPQGLVERLNKYPKHIPVLYTGGLENHPQVYLALQQQRPVWGYLHPDPLHGNSIRNPEYLDHIAKTKAIHRPGHERSCRDTARWLIKPRAGAGGRGIRFWNGEPIPSTHFLEEYLEGTSLAAAFIHSESGTLCIGFTGQLVGTGFAHAPTPFSYTGSLVKPWQGSAVLRSPLQTSQATRGQMSTSDPCHSLFDAISLQEEMERIAQALTQADSYLKGLFGADFILHDGMLYLLEVNPRYTASIEVLELSLGISSLALHAKAFGCDIPMSPRQPTGTILGKAIYFAPRKCTFPTTGPWSAATHHNVWAIPEYADIPAAGTLIEPGHPVLTLFAQGVDTSEVMHRLQEKAKLVDQLW